MICKKFFSKDKMSNFGKKHAGHPARSRSFSSIIPSNEDMHMGSFKSNFGRRSESTFSFPSRTSSETTEVVHINMDDIETKLARLRPLADREIRSLSGEPLSDYRELVQYAKVLYDTDLYGDFHRTVTNHFGDLREIKPGTLGAYFAGCLSQMKFGVNINVSDNCSVICAGQMPLPKSEDTMFCPSTVLMALNDGHGGYDFHTLHEGSGGDLLIYVDTKNGSFTGFSEAEKEKLKKYGADKIKIYRHSSDGRTSTELTNGGLNLQELPSRVNVTTNGGSSQNTNTLMIVLAIFLILVALFIGWKIWSN